MIKVNKTSVWNWERNRCQPAISQIPKLVEFLGHIQVEPKTVDIGSRLRALRTLSGMSQKVFARLLRIDPSTLSRLELGISVPGRSTLRRVEQFLEVHRLIK